jgi:hypothetical protein
MKNKKKRGENVTTTTTTNEVTTPEGRYQNAVLCVISLAMSACACLPATKTSEISTTTTGYSPQRNKLIRKIQ